MNHFFAIKLSDEARDTVDRAATAWRPKVMRSSWYDPEDYHITLKFLGNLEDSEQPRLIKAATPVARKAHPILIRPASYGGFPNLRDPDVLWAGVEISPELEALATFLDQVTAELGFRPDHHRYQPHITVARCRLRTTASHEWPVPDERLFEEFRVDRFVLMETRLGEGHANRTGLRYNTVQTFPFGNTQFSDVS